MITNIPLLSDPYNAPKITIVEGPDGSGKSTLVKQIQKHITDNHIEIELISLRFPDNKGQATFRDVILSESLAQYPGAQLFLFLGDMIHSFESLIKPHLNNPKVKFVIDRFIPSTCVYQKASIAYINHVITHRYEEFANVFSDANYHYIIPTNIEAHKLRLANKTGDEINHLDPVGEEAMLTQIEDYRNFATRQLAIGLLNGYDVTIHEV